MVIAQEQAWFRNISGKDKDFLQTPVLRTDSYQKSTSHDKSNWRIQDWVLRLFILRANVRRDVLIAVDTHYTLLREMGFFLRES